MTSLAERRCVPCRGNIPSLTKTEISELLPQVPGWQILEVDGIPRLERVFKFENFSEALAFTNKIGALAEEEDHHPLIVTEWGRVKVQWWTHVLNGLHKNDFIMAARINNLIE